jgi:hypothetical protein
MVQWIGRSMGRGVRPSGNVSKPRPPPADPNGGAPGMERTMTCALTVWGLQSERWQRVRSFRAATRRSTRRQASRATAMKVRVLPRGLSVRPLLCVVGGEAVAGDRLASGERLCSEERSGCETSLARLAGMRSRRGGFVGPPESAVTTEGCSVRAWSGSADIGRLSGLDGGLTLTGTAVKNTGHSVATNGSARTTLAARGPVTTTVRTRWWRLPR